MLIRDRLYFTALCRSVMDFYLTRTRCGEYSIVTKLPPWGYIFVEGSIMAARSVERLVTTVSRGWHSNTSCTSIFKIYSSVKVKGQAGSLQMVEGQAQFVKCIPQSILRITMRTY